MEYKTKYSILCKLKSSASPKKQLSLLLFCQLFDQFSYDFFVFLCFLMESYQLRKMKKTLKNPLYFVCSYLLNFYSTEVWNRIWKCSRLIEFCTESLQLWNLSSILSSLDVYKFNLFYHVKFQVGSWNTRQMVLGFWCLVFRTKSNILLC